MLAKGNNVSVNGIFVEVLFCLICQGCMNCGEMLPDKMSFTLNCIKINDQILTDRASFMVEFRVRVRIS